MLDLPDILLNEIIGWTGHTSTPASGGTEVHNLFRSCRALHRLKRDPMVPALSLLRHTYRDEQHCFNALMQTLTAGDADDERNLAIIDMIMQLLAPSSPSSHCPPPPHFMQGLLLLLAIHDDSAGIVALLQLPARLVPSVNVGTAVMSAVVGHSTQSLFSLLAYGDATLQTGMEAIRMVCGEPDLAPMLQYLVSWFSPRGLDFHAPLMVDAFKATFDADNVAGMAVFWNAFKGQMVSLQAFRFCRGKMPHPPLPDRIENGHGGWSCGSSQGTPGGMHHVRRCAWAWHRRLRCCYRPVLQVSPTAH